MSPPPFTARDLGEVAIRCRDLSAMTEFYRDLIGLEVIAGAYAPHIVFLRVAPGFGGHTQVVALFRDEGAVASGPAGSLHHLALTVAHAELPGALDWFRAQGLVPTTAHHAWVGWDSVYVKDPEGNTVELVAAVPQGGTPLRFGARGDSG